VSPLAPYSVGLLKSHTKACFQNLQAVFGMVTRKSRSEEAKANGVIDLTDTEGRRSSYVFR